MYCFVKKRRAVISLIIISLMMVLISGCTTGTENKENSSGVPSGSSSALPNDTSSNIDTADANVKDVSADTLDGGTFTQDDLTKYDLTMVNIWTTWCGYCIQEMPDLQKLYKDMLPDNVNMISICADANDELDLAKKIIDEQNCSFKTLIPDDKLKESILNDISAFPTTIFLDSKGNLVGKPQVGVPRSTEGVAAGYLEVIKKRLELAAN